MFLVYLKYLKYLTNSYFNCHSFLLEKCALNNKKNNVIVLKNIRIFNGDINVVLLVIMY
jgi:hypothetical protein